jgi:hypothetical protein
MAKRADLVRQTRQRTQRRCNPVARRNDQKPKQRHVQCERSASLTVSTKETERARQRCERWLRGPLQQEAQRRCQRCLSTRRDGENKKQANDNKEYNVKHADQTHCGACVAVGENDCERTRTRLRRSEPSRYTALDTHKRGPLARRRCLGRGCARAPEGRKR